MKNLLILTFAVIVGASCSVKPSNKGRTPAPTAEQIAVANAERAASSNAEAGSTAYKAPVIERGLRTGPQYMAAIAKTLNLTSSSVKEAVNFEDTKAALAVSTEATEQNISSNWLVATVKSAGKACTLYMSKSENKAKDFKSVIDELAKRAISDDAKAKAVIAEAMAIADMANGNDDKSQVGCAFVVSAVNFML
jgi:hypothetical protein